MKEYCTVRIEVRDEKQVGRGSDRLSVVISSMIFRSAPLRHETNSKVSERHACNNLYQASFQLPHLAPCHSEKSNKM